MGTKKYHSSPVSQRRLVTTVQNALLVIGTLVTAYLVYLALQK